MDVQTPEQQEKRPEKRKPFLLWIFLILVAGAVSINAVILSDYVAWPKNPEDAAIPEGDIFNQYPSMSIDEVLASVKGRIPILEYHIILTPSVRTNLIMKGKLKYNKKTERFFVSSDEFREELKILYENRFRNISLNEYLSLMKGMKKDLNRLPPDSKLYVLTFDDATFGQFDFISNSNGEINVDPDSAVGIMIDFAREHPDFKLNAAFSIPFDKPPFFQSQFVDKKLNILLDLGFEIVNHTTSHKRLSRLLPGHPEAAAREIGRAMELFESYLGYRAGTIDKICYPDGGANEIVWKFIQEVPYNGKTYHFNAALSATGYQAKNPNDETFNPYSIARIEINRETFGSLVLKADNLFKTPILPDRVIQPNVMLTQSPYSSSNVLDLIKLQ